MDQVQGAQSELVFHECHSLFLLRILHQISQNGVQGLGGYHLFTDFLGNESRQQELTAGLALYVHRAAIEFRVALVLGVVFFVRNRSFSFHIERVGNHQVSPVLDVFGVAQRSVDVSARHLNGQRARIDLLFPEELVLQKGFLC